MISFFVPGRPTPQGSKRAFVNKHSGKPIVVEMGGDRLKLWRHGVNDQARRHWDGKEPMAGPVAVTMRFLMPKPKKPAKGVTHPIGRLSGDIDKLARAVLDGLTSVVFLDDSQVVELVASKAWGVSSGVWIRLDQVSHLRGDTINDASVHPVQDPPHQGPHSRGGG